MCGKLQGGAGAGVSKTSAFSEGNSFLCELWRSGQKEAQGV